MEKTRIQYIKEAANKLVDSKLQRLGAAKTQEIFKLFWNYDLSEEEARQMLANSTLKDTP